MTQILALIVGSIAGGFSRYFLAGFISRVFDTAFPYGTLVVNLTGCLLIGLFSSLAEKKFLLGPSAQLLLMTGFCGAFTTFSTFMLETGNLIRDGEASKALLNVLVSVLAGFVCFKLGVILGKII